MSHNRSYPLALAVFGLIAVTVQAGVEWGGSLAPGRNQNLRLLIGAATEFEGMVEETRRKVYDVQGESWKQDLAESYDSDDFDMDGPFGAIGLSYDVAGRFVRFQIDTLFLKPSTRTTAKRDYYLSIQDEIDYRGESYDHLLIPEGRTFEAEIAGNMTELTLMLVPAGVHAGNGLRINPSLDVGVLLFGGKYEIDAGETTGVETYQNPPKEFAVGGETSAWVGMFAPQWGPGLDVRFGQDDGVQIALQAHYLFFDYSGDSGLFTTADHREKELEFEHRNFRFRGQAEIPLRKTTLTVGVQVQMVETEGTIESGASDPEEILARRERFDKEFAFQIQTVLATVGLTF